MLFSNKQVNCAFLILLSLSAPGTSLAQGRAVRERVVFASATEVDGNVPVSGELRVPDLSGAKLPAVVVIHSAGGIDGTGTPYIESLNQAGIATLELDLFPSGGRPATARLNLPHTYGSLIYLARHPRIDPARIGIMGFSWGGILSLFSASEELTRQYTGGKYRFAAHLPLYPVCWAQTSILQGKNKNYSASTYQAFTGAPVHILAGAKDDYDDDPDACPKFVQALPAAAHSFVTATVYAGVGHGWDVPRSRQYQDGFAHVGRGGWVYHYRDAATAEKSRAFAVEFFKSNLGAK
jgi:dienelactone hydrolase